MSTDQEKIVNDLDDLAKERDRLEREMQTVDQQFQDQEVTRRTAHQARKAAIQAEIDTIDSKIWSIFESNRSWLIAKGKKFLALPGGTFQFRASSESIHVPDPRALMRVAKQQRLIKEVSKPPSSKWAFSLTKFRDWWKKNPSKRSIFAAYVEESPESESLSLEPNIPRVDNTRKTPPPIPIKRKSKPRAALQ